MIKTIALIFSIHKKQIQTDLGQVLQKERERLEILLDRCYTEQLKKIGLNFEKDKKNCF